MARVRSCYRTEPRRGRRKISRAEKAKKDKRKQGQADPLREGAWVEVAEHFKHNGNAPWLYPVWLLLYTLCMRVGQVVLLRGDGFKADLTEVWARPFKHRAEGVYKPIPPPVRTKLAELKRFGFAMDIKRSKRTFKATWKWRQGLLFPSDHPNARLKNLSVNSVQEAIRRARKNFQTTDKRVDVAKIRSHSGKHRWVNQAKVTGVPEHVGQTYAEIKHTKTYNDTYGQVDMEQAAKQLSGFRCFNANMRG